MSVIKTGTTSTTGYIVESDTNGNLVIQTGSTPTTALTLHSNQTATFAQSVNIPNTFGFKNRIINGGMVIDQRNAGASVTFANTGGYSVDRWRISNAVSTVTAQRSTIAPTGFNNSLLITVTSADSNPPSAGTSHAIQYYIEGLNTADLGWGTANAQAVTLSFWVRSSLTGTYGIQIGNESAATRAYVAQYTINSANTFEYKTITIPGDTTGTWATGTGIGIAVLFDLGSGSNFQTASANTWVATDSRRISGNALFASTASATFYITGVQLERGSTATSFDFRPYGTELALCQRYYWKTYNQSAVPGFASSSATYRARSYSGSYAAAVVQFPVLMRAVPSCTLYNSNTGATNSWRDVDNNADRSASLSTILDNAVCTESSSVTVNTTNMFQIVASAEL